ncbi:MAG: hypothetical protein UR68_C0013G0005 [Candidatus Roizmanbacteria bacterium GW2011_GWA2_35_19]|uniref:Uncharacterized protein n=2 Tax=Candidatus Roizmaniibacteriota TaxID=1752723 RepID=A0A0G0F012_9BACT|nr:MAG: hypothetical protein UR63_C0020G0007 [Candidatus Roizmanbacteria bacterium GW2011_GWC2_35_12]KKP72692.1 MAG: hypothetical protein UR68_C0013G0005 [Candidatus Roizmanbacteria bacterium GW2011_GWA2_35_19]
MAGNVRGQKVTVDHKTKIIFRDSEIITVCSKNINSK